jgi:uncharacterized protein YndB with AHSA1/START domain
MMIRAETRTQINRPVEDVFENMLEVVEREPNQRLVLTTDSPFAVRATWLFEPVDGGTGFTSVLEAQPSASAFFKFGEPFLSAVARRRFTGHLRRLKKRLETPAEGQQRAA